MGEDRLINRERPLVAAGVVGVTATVVIAVLAWPSGDTRPTSTPPSAPSVGVTTSSGPHSTTPGPPSSSVALTGEPVTSLPKDPPRPRDVPPRPSTTPRLPESVDGCDHAYGRRNQCVPWSFPAGVVDGCAYLRDKGFGPLAVHGRDRHGLDRDGDGTACGRGD